jgi:hypothetical protein
MASPVSDTDTNAYNEAVGRLPADNELRGVPVTTFVNLTESTKDDALRTVGLQLNGTLNKIWKQYNTQGVSLPFCISFHDWCLWQILSAVPLLFCSPAYWLIFLTIYG